MPKYDFSVVVPVLNGEAFISKCIDSLILQRDSGIKLQIIVVDGGSTDRTLHLLRNYSSAIDILISEKRLNQTRSLKKGFELAEGKILSWLNADDMYNDGALFKVKKAFELNKGISFVYGNCIYVNEQNVVLKVNKTHSAMLPYLLNYTDFMLSQEACFWIRKCYNECGGLDPAVDYAMDYELFCKLIKNGSALYINEDLASCLVHKKQRHREKSGEFTYWNIERAKIQYRNNHRQSIFIRYLLVVLLMAYKNIVVEKKVSLTFSRINSVAFFSPFSTVSITKKESLSQTNQENK